MSSRPKETRVEPTGPCGPGRPPRRLLQFDDRALRFELLSDFFGFLLGHAFLHGPGRAFHQILGLKEAKDLVEGDRKSTRLNSSHSQISYAVFCLKKKKKEQTTNLPH